MAEHGGTVAELDETLLALAELPPRFAQHYDGRFARKFLVATVMVNGRLSAKTWERPASIAEALALHVVIKRAKDLLVDHGVFDEQAAQNRYAALQDAAFEDVDHELLYRYEMDEDEEPSPTARTGLLDMRVQSWFQSNNKTAAHPFSIGFEAA